MKNVSTDAHGKIHFKSIVFEADSSRRQSSDFQGTRKIILKSILKFLDDRFDADASFVQTLSPFITFNPEADVELIHETLALDLSLANFSLQFDEVSNNPDLHKDLSLSEIIVKLAKTSESRNNYRELITVLARIAACCPNSADVERCISSNNRLKTKLRNRLTVETENKYLFVHHNMPCVQEWNPTAAANLFVAEKMRRERITTTAKDSKTRAQRYFKGVFPEARQLCDPDPEDPSDIDDTEEEATTHSRFDF